MTETTRAAEPAPPDPRERVEWVDTAKGVAIILVVLFHAVIFLGDIGLAGPWATIDGPLDTFRMPLFFFTAGLFAQKALRFGFGELTRRRLVRFGWLYVLWTTIWAIAFQFIPLHREVDTSHPFGAWARSLVWPNESTWFVYALVVYFTVAWLLVRCPVWVQCVVALVPAVVFGSGILNSGNTAVNKIAMYFVFFLAAAQLSTRVFALARRASWWHLVVLALVYVGVVGASVLLHVLRVPGVRLVAGILGVAFGVTLAVVVSRYAMFRWLTALGRRTLPIYFVHFYVVLGGVALLAVAPTDGIPTVVWVPALTALGVIIPLFVERLLRRVTWLWASPFPGTNR
jgi:uncharacterized membrane protein YcfT